jgi:hypothetical protein
LRRTCSQEPFGLAADASVMTLRGSLSGGADPENA